MLQSLQTKLAVMTAVSLGVVNLTFAQSPGEPGVMNNPTGHPSYTELNKRGQDATVIFGNSDGAKQTNEYIYFKVYPYGSGNNLDGYDWYYNPTAWISAFDFHFFNTNLRMYGNVIKFNNAPKNRRVIFDQDPSSTDDYQFTGFGSTDNNDLRYQVKDATKSHKFFAGLDVSSAKSLLTINGNGRIQLPKSSQLDLGAGETKEENAGTISYKRFSDGLDIVGAGTTNVNRVIKVWAEKGTSFNGLVSIGSDQYSYHTVPPTSLPGGVNLSSYKLFVNGGVLAKEVRVETGWADYVFKPDYKLLPLADVERHIQACGYLPGMPSAHEVEQDGINLGQIVKLQQEKIEELTLHLIAMKKELEAVNTQLRQLTSVSATK